MARVGPASGPVASAQNFSINRRPAHTIFKSSIEFKDAFLAGLAGGAASYFVRVVAAAGGQGGLALLVIGLLGFVIATAFVLQSVGGMDLGTAAGLAGSAAVIQTIAVALLVWGLTSLAQ